MNFFKKGLIVAFTVLFLVAGLFGCTPKGENQGEQKQGLSGTIKVDGSSTVYPISEAMAEEFRAQNPDVNITIGVSGTGGGFKKFSAGEIDITNASRPIKDEEKEALKKNNIEYVELKIAYDGIAVVVNKNNTWVDSLTVEELKKIWEPGSKVKTWKDVRPEWPAEPIKLYAPGVDSGTFDYFTEAINGEEGAIRQDFTPSEDDNVLVQGVAGDKNAMAFFGLAYYEENKDKLKVVKIDAGQGPVEPTFETVKSGQYKPLSRPLFIYVNKKSLERPEVRSFVEFYLTHGKDLVRDVGYINLPDEEYTEELNKLK